MSIFSLSNNFIVSIQLLLILIVSSCVESEGKIEILDEIRMAKEIKIAEGLRKKEISLKNLFSINKYVILESDSLSFLSAVDKIQVHNRYMYILDKKQSLIKVFDLNGKFIKNFVKIGKGPGEVSQLIDFIIDRKGNKVILYDTGNSSIQIYSLKGILLSQIKFFPYFSKMELFEPGLLIFYLGNNFFEEAGANNFIICNYQGAILEKLIPFDKENCKLFGFGGILTNTKNEMLCTNGVSNLVYSIKREKNEITYKPKYYFNFDKNTLIEGDCRSFNGEWQNLKSKYIYSKLFELDNNLFFDFLDKDLLKKGFVINGRLIIDDQIKDDYLFRVLGKVIATNDSKIIFCIKPVYVASLFENSSDVEDLKKQDIDLYNLLRKSQKTDAPIIVFANVNSKFK